MPYYFGSVNLTTIQRQENVMLINRNLLIPTYLSEGALFVDYVLNVFNAGYFSLL
jgi:hypothetical protein